MTPIRCLQTSIPLTSQFLTHSYTRTYTHIRTCVQKLMKERTTSVLLSWKKAGTDSKLMSTNTSRSQIGLGQLLTISSCKQLTKTSWSKCPASGLLVTLLLLLWESVNPAMSLYNILVSGSSSLDVTKLSLPHTAIRFMSGTVYIHALCVYCCHSSNVYTPFVSAVVIAAMNIV